MPVRHLRDTKGRYCSGYNFVRLCLLATTRAAGRRRQGQATFAAKTSNTIQRLEQLNSRSWVGFDVNLFSVSCRTMSLHEAGASCECRCGFISIGSHFGESSARR